MAFFSYKPTIYQLSNNTILHCIKNDIKQFKLLNFSKMPFAYYKCRKVIISRKKLKEFCRKVRKSLRIC